MFGIGLQVFHADRRFENNTRWKPYLVPSRFRSFRFLWHLTAQLNATVMRKWLRYARPSPTSTAPSAHPSSQPAPRTLWFKQHRREGQCTQYVGDVVLLVVTQLIAITAT